MRISSKQRIDLESIEYFISDPYRHIDITDQDKADFLLFSDRGKVPPHREGQIRYRTGQNGSKKDVDLGFFTSKKLNGYQLLFLGKSRRGLHVQLWEDGITAGETPIYCLVGGEGDDEPLPESVMLFMSKALFSKGIEAFRDSFKQRWESVWRDVMEEKSDDHLNSLLKRVYSRENS